EDGARDRVEAGPLRCELEEHRDRPVRLGSRLREEALGDLALNHHAPPLERRQPVEALDHHRRRDVVGQVRDELARRRLEVGQVDLECVADLEPEVRDLGQVRFKRPIDLDRMHERDPFGQVPGEDAEPGTDLEDDVIGLELGEPADHSEDVLVDEKMLAELFLRADARHSPKAAFAFASTCASSSEGSSSRAAATAASVCTTFAGSFGRPRTGCGARYGLSVSTSTRSAGTWLAASRSSDAFGKLTFPANET